MPKINNISSYTDEIELGDNLVFGITFYPVEKQNKLHYDEYLKVTNNCLMKPYFLRCKNIDL